MTTTTPTIKVRLGDCIDRMTELDGSSVDSVVVDPPYGLSQKEPDVRKVLEHWLNGDDYEHRGGGFMGKDWDSFVPGPSVWAEAMRVLKPGGYMLCFAGSRTVDLMGISIRMAGFEVVDMIQWLYGSGFPKSHNVAAKLQQKLDAGVDLGVDPDDWQGYGTALKPAHEPIVVARKPLRIAHITPGGRLSSKKATVAENIAQHGVGAFNIDAARVPLEGGEVVTAGLSDPANRTGIVGEAWQATGDAEKNMAAQQASIDRANELGRWPANVVMDEEAGALLDEQAGDRSPGSFPANNRTGMGEGYLGEGGTRRGHEGRAQGTTGSGGASRYFYCAKASKKEREAGLEDFEPGERGLPNQGMQNMDGGRPRARKNTHPTVKPIALMRWLVRLVTPIDGVVLDPYMGSGTTGIAAILEGMSFIGIEAEAEYRDIAVARLKHWKGVHQHELATADQRAAEARLDAIRELAAIACEDSCPHDCRDLIEGTGLSRCTKYDRAQDVTLHTTEFVIHCCECGDGIDPGRPLTDEERALHWSCGPCVAKRAPVQPVEEAVPA